MAEDAAHAGDSMGTKKLAGLSLAALGIVYGDIGTSPIYAIRESFMEAHGVAATAANVLGVLSLIFWSLIIVISIKYLTLVMQADNDGEGGIIALTALVSPRGRSKVLSRSWWLVLAGLFGASLLWGDSMITPAISVLSAIEGLAVATPVFEPFIIPITVGILIGLFAFQSRGTAGVGAIFGPITLVWFLTLGALGTYHLVQNPGVFVAVSPHYAAEFFVRNTWDGFFVLGSVFLVATGGEALYADMGHFGTKPIRLTWFSIVLPALLLNYYGQGALVLSQSDAISHPFYNMVSGWGLYPLVAIATAATVIASQAVISGAFSLTQQAVQLGYLPRMEIRHTSAEHKGQIYMPLVNWALMVACIGLVIGFGSSSKLAAAYGVAVTTDMVFTTVLFAVVAHKRFRWNPYALGAIVIVLLTVDLGFWTATLKKIPDGGWFPLLVAAVFFVVLTTWKKGRQILGRRIEEKTLSWAEFRSTVREEDIPVVEGTAVYMHSKAENPPPALIDNVTHNKVVHERIVALTVETLQTPRARPEERVEIEKVGAHLYRMRMRFGFAEDPDIPAQLAEIELDEEGFDMEETTFFLGREILLATEREGMMIWREQLFARLSRNALRATAYFHLPPERVVEIAMQVEL